MLPFAILLLHVALTSGIHILPKNWRISITRNTLTELGVTGQVSDNLELSYCSLDSFAPNIFDNFNFLRTLNLSHNSLRTVPKDTFSGLRKLINLDLGNNDITGGGFFDGLTSLKILNLSHNALRTLPKGTFSNLTNLLHLDLSNNNIKGGGFYSGLRNLKTLNIANNPLDYDVQSYHFGGLPNFTDIITQQVQFSSINSLIFETNPQKRKDKAPRRAGKRGNKIHVYINEEIQICFENDHLKSLKNVNEMKRLRKNCEIIKSDNGSINLNGLEIKTFESGWYRVKKSAIEYLNLCNNKILEITKTLLNDLPRKIINVNLCENRITKLDSDVIEREETMETLDLSKNRIIHIERGALKNLNLRQLILNNNRLTNTSFLDSLSLNINIVSLVGNKIVEISSGNFSRLKKLREINLDGNKIREAKAQSLWGLSSLNLLTLSNNRLRNIEPGFFKDLRNLRQLKLSGNEITNLKKGVFNGLEKIFRIDLSRNKLKKIKIGVFSRLPITMQSLYLTNNRIESLEAGAFVNISKFLYLDWNKISKIENGSLDLPELKILNLRHNSLTMIDDGMFERLESVRKVLLTLNNITRIRKGATKNLRRLQNLDLSYNPIKRLTNGALFGLSKRKRCLVQLSGVYIEIIQSGLFDDV